MRIKTLMLLLISFLLNSSLSLSQIKVSIPDTTASPGDTLLVPVYINNITDSDNIFAFDIIISYDTSKVKSIYDQKIGTFSSGFMTYFNSHYPDNY